MITVNAGFARIPAKAATANLTKTDWGVLHAICLHADKDGRAFPSMARIAEIAEMRRNHVPRSIARLEKRGLLRRRRVPRPTGGWQVTHYEILFEPLGDVTNTGDTGSEMSPTEVTGCHQHREQGVTPSGALTNHLTNQGTEEAYQEETQKEGVGLNGGGVPSTGDTKADEPAACPGPNPGTPDPADAGAEGHGQIDPAVALDPIPPPRCAGGRWAMGAINRPSRA